MSPAGDGWFEVFASGCGAGERYRFVLSRGRRIADPASRFQPEDVHGPSEVVDPSSYAWVHDWGSRPWDETTLYELHVGAFTKEGTFAAAAQKAKDVAALGVTAIEIMPVGDFPGRWNWGYDGVFPFAPDTSYGAPDDFKALVDTAHGHGVSVLLDVVYNHFGPEGNVWPLCAPDFFTERHKTPWGPAINFDGPRSEPVRSFFIENAEYWLAEFHLDGLRLDAVHAIFDESPMHILEELADRVRSRFDRPVHLLLEHEGNDPAMLVRRGREPLFYTAQWNDDLHHVLHVAATREKEGYYAAYGSAKLLGRALAEGFAYQGEKMPTRAKPRGGPSGFLPPDAFVAFIQNHDQIGNRAFGERLNVLTSLEAMRALVGVYLLAPQTPMIFMGEEWSAKTPFLFFCDFGGELADAVRQGRRNEFSRFSAFADEEKRSRIPDPLAESTFLASKLDWSQADPDQAAFYRRLLALRRLHVAPLLASMEHGGRAETLGPEAVRVIWPAGAQSLILDANLSRAPTPFPMARGEPFFTLAETGGLFGAWAVRWSIE
jgi:maltooligosyltrehalose trehalohydrolase